MQKDGKGEEERACKACYRVCTGKHAREALEISTKPGGQSAHGRDPFSALYFPGTQTAHGPPEGVQVQCQSASCASRCCNL